MLHFCCHGSKSDVMMASSVVKTLDFKKVKKKFSELFLAVLVTWSSYWISKLISLYQDMLIWLTHLTQCQNSVLVILLVGSVKQRIPYVFLWFFLAIMPKKFQSQSGSWNINIYIFFWNISWCGNFPPPPSPESRQVYTKRDGKLIATQA